MKIFKKFLDAGFNFQIKDSEVILREDKKIIFEIPFEEDSRIEDLIEENCNYHLKMISIKDSEYFEGCDAEYLQNEWKDLILKIKYLAKGVDKMIKNDLEAILKKVKLLELENEMLKSQNEKLLNILRSMQEKLKEWMK